MSGKGLPPEAYKPSSQGEYVPFTSGKILPEFTIKAVLTGIVLGIVFGAANTFLGLKAGLTISTSIPVAVLTVVVFRALGRFGARHSILEANMSQTIGSASSSVASGVLFTLPALFLWGLQPDLLEISLLAMAGGLLGVFFMIPLRAYLIRREHGNLLYPEGMACAEVLVAAEGESSQASKVFWGLGIGAFFKWLTSGLKLVAEKGSLALPLKGEIAASVSPALLGVGYILGVRVAAVMVAGAALSALIITPAIYLWGRDLLVPFYPEPEKLIQAMSAREIWERYVRYIGAGAVATGGILTLVKSLPTMVESFKVGLSNVQTKAATTLARTERDIPLTQVALGILLVLAMLALIPGLLGFMDSLAVRVIASFLIAVFAFFFVTVSARIVGLVGVTSNPTSGMTIATLLGTSLIFYLLGWRDLSGKATALLVGTAVCIAASIAGDTSQDLKTGFILGASPRLQQLGEMLGVVTSAGFVCYTLILLDRTYVVGSPDLPAPQGTLMNMVITGVLDQNLPWGLIFIGVAIGLAAAAIRLPVLAFAVGVYLPLSTMAPIFFGGLLRHLLSRKVSPETGERRREGGVLFASGLVGGEGLLGVLLAMWVVFVRNGEKIKGFLPPHMPEYFAPLTALFALTVLVAILAHFACRNAERASKRS